MLIFLPVLLILHIPVFSEQLPIINIAFVLDNQLWMKEETKEYQLTRDKEVVNLKWSYDGGFIAYLHIGEKGDASQLWIYDTNKKVNYKPYDWIETKNYKWSPTNQPLAYTSNGVLNITQKQDGIPKGFENVVLGVSDFEWFPNGKEFIVSSTANLLPTGWGPIPLFKLPFDTNLDSKKVEHFYTIESDKDMFAIDFCYFKWSNDGN
ncbi:hypothetical protein [Sutcliffiella rhizosphaerae]|nr:hypothetical protein [Sutcliffiella rhizosphaerae]